MTRAAISLLALGAILAAGDARAAVVSVAALKDSTIFGTAAGADTGNAAGRGPFLIAGADGTGGRKRSLIEFDLASAGIPTNATIGSVTMTLHLAQVAGSSANYTSRTIRLYALQQDWGEGSSGSPTSAGVNSAGQGYPRVVGDSTWDYASFDPANLASGTWNAGGPNLHGGNFASVESAASTFTSFTMTNAAFTWSSPGMAADVQRWVNSGAGNFGWLLKSDLEDMPTSFLAFWSRDGAAANSNPSIAPSLSIAYSVPEPGGAALVACGVMGLVARRPRR
ncbi:MAG: uncharacterized protein JWN40_1249 [Phycisphaerales bacterium]|nr:uncharacterized protein [Phycisphaerales bacterium]